MPKTKIETLTPNIHRIEIPLFGNPLKTVNSYVVQTPERTLIIDTAWNRPDALEALTGGLAQLGVDPTAADYFVTHRHPDHYSLVTSIASKSSIVYMGALDIAYLEAYSTNRPDMLAQAMSHGFPGKVLQDAAGRLAASPPSERLTPVFTPVEEGDVIRVGDLNFTCIDTPGHSQGHVCLYEPDLKFFVAGDHILGNVTPNISGFFQDRSPLHDYRASLEKVAGYDVTLTLPGHRNLVRDFRGRIGELIRHQETRSAEVRSLLAHGPHSAYEMAGVMHWDMAASWADFPTMQQWFATGEALSHLLYLVTEGIAVEDASDEITRYRLS
jgi:glyoxylase-like metal-dependent hydrolase (beta-lactamase superfamily II)